MSESDNARPPDSQQQFLNEDGDDSDDNEMGGASLYNESFLALNAPVEDKTKVVIMDEILQDQEILKKDTNMEPAPVIIEFDRDKRPVSLNEEFLFAKAFPQSVRYTCNIYIYIYNISIHIYIYTPIFIIPLFF